MSYESEEGTMTYAVAVVDSDGDVLCAYGPFDTEEAADDWTPPPGMTNDCVVIGIYEPVKWSTH
jgi:hypothetical protein